MKIQKRTQIVDARTEVYDVYVGRGGFGHDGYFSNPFPISECDGREHMVARFKTYFLERVEEDAGFCKRVLDLKNKRLGCYDPAHAGIIVDWLNEIGDNE